MEHKVFCIWIQEEGKTPRLHQEPRTAPISGRFWVGGPPTAHQIHVSFVAPEASLRRLSRSAHGRADKPSIWDDVKKGTLNIWTSVYENDEEARKRDPDLPRWEIGPIKNDWPPRKPLEGVRFINLYGFRHTCATELIRQNVSVPVIAERLGTSEEMIQAVSLRLFLGHRSVASNAAHWGIRRSGRPQRTRLEPGPGGSPAGQLLGLW